MNRKLILHIGHPKTGTTTLQKTLQASRPALAENGILHPFTGSTGNKGNNWPLLRNLLHEGDTKLTGSDISEAEKLWRSVLYQIDTENPHTIILSSEQLFRRTVATKTTSLASNLKKLASEIIVVAYLREPAAYRLSQVQQQMKSKPSFSMREGDFFRATLEPYQTSGIGQMNVRVFDRDKLKHGNIVHDFFEHNLPGFDTTNLTQLAEKNLSMSAEAMSLLQEIHRGERIFRIGKPRNEIPHLDQRLDGFSRPRMHAHVRSAIQATCTDLSWVHEQFDVHFPDMNSSAMSVGEASRILAGLDTVEDICLVDKDRKADLWAALNRADEMFIRFFRRA